MDERLRFVARLLEGEKMAPLCAEFGISRKTGYKIPELRGVRRIVGLGVAGTCDERPRSGGGDLPPVLRVAYRVGGGLKCGSAGCSG